MSKALICDRCGNTYSTKSSGIEYGLTGRKVPITVKIHPTGDKEFRRKMQLCSDCSCKLKDFMECKESE